MSSHWIWPETQASRDKPTSWPPSSASVAVPTVLMGRDALPASCPATSTAEAMGLGTMGRVGW